MNTVKISFNYIIQLTLTKLVADTPPSSYEYTSSIYKYVPFILYRLAFDRIKPDEP